MGVSLEVRQQLQHRWIMTDIVLNRLSRSDVRELLPELFTIPDFLTNTKNKFELGQLQGSEAAIDSVILPPWAKGRQPVRLLQRHRAQAVQQARHVYSYSGIAKRSNRSMSRKDCITGSTSSSVTCKDRSMTATSVGCNFLFLPISSRD